VLSKHFFSTQIHEISALQQELSQACDSSAFSACLFLTETSGNKFNDAEFTGKADFSWLFEMHVTVSKL